MARKAISGLYQKGGVWQIDKVFRGERLRESTGTSDRQETEQYLIHRLEQLRQQKVYGVRRIRTWEEAATRPLIESKDQPSIKLTAHHLKQLHPYLKDLPLTHIDDQALEPLVKDRLKGMVLPCGKQLKPVAPRTINISIERVIRFVHGGGGMKSAGDVRALIRTVINRGAHRQAISFFADLTQMFSWARKRQPWRTLLVEGDPTELVDISPLIPADYEAERSRILSPAELLELHNCFQQMTADYNALPAGQKYEGVRPLKKETQLALWISLGTLCRIGELLQAEWKNVDLDRQTWFLPSENVKGSRGKKQDHHVFLSPFALHFFEELKILTGDSQWCFPNKLNDGHVDVKVVSKQVGDRQARFKNRKALSRRCHDDTLVLADGQNGDWTPHDLRRTGATMMQALGVSLDVIDRCQNHVLAGSRVRRHYLHHDYAEEKKRAWDLLGDRLSAVLSSTYEHSPTEPMLSFPEYSATETRTPS